MTAFNSTGLYSQIAAALSQLQVSDQSSDHRAELAGWQGWNYVAIQAVMSQVSRSQAYVYDDSKVPEAKEVRKRLRAKHGWNWTKMLHKHPGEIVGADHKLAKLLKRPNPAQSGAHFRMEQVQQLRLHGSCLVFNRPNRLHTRTIERYVVPWALVETVPPGTRKGMPLGGIRIRPTDYMDRLGAAAMQFGNMSPVLGFINCEVPVQMLSIARYPHPFLKSEGSSPTYAIRKWIDSASHIDNVRMQFYGYGPNGQVIVSVDGEVSPEQCREWERQLQEKLGPDGPPVAVLGKGQAIASQRTAEDMGFEEGHDQMKAGILATHRVSRVMLGDQDSMTFGAVEASLFASTLLSIQPDMDLLADEDTLDLGKEYEGDISIEYEIPPIESPERDDERLASDSTKCVITVGEYRRARNMEPFGDERDDMMMGKDGPITVEQMIGGSGGGGEQGGGAGGAISPWQFSHKSPIQKSMTQKSDAMSTFDMPVVAVDYGTLVDSSGKKERLAKGMLESISLLQKCGCKVSAITTGDTAEAAGMLKAMGLDLPVNLPEASVIWDMVADGVDAEDRLDDLRRIADLLPGPSASALSDLLGGGKYAYGCVMLPLSGAAMQAVLDVGRAIPDHMLAGSGREVEPHVTLLYGLAGEDPIKVSQHVGRMGAPSVVLGNAIAFDTKDGAVPIVIEIESQQLQDMNKSLRQNCKHVQFYSEYRPHVTVAYVRPEYASQFCGPTATTGMAIELPGAKVTTPGSEPVNVPLVNANPIPEPSNVSGPVSIATFEQLEHYAGAEDREIMSLLKSLHDRIDTLGSGQVNKSQELTQSVPDLKVAGLAVMAEDTGRLLMLQRSLSDDDPASGDWEFPGGHIEEGERPIEAAKREWSEETGHIVPNGREVSHWDSGIYRGHVWLIRNESQVQLNLGREEKHVLNPDDPDGDNIEVVAWYSPGQMIDNGALRQELREAMPEVMEAINAARKCCKSPQAFKPEVDKYESRLEQLAKRRDPEDLFVPESQSYSVGMWGGDDIEKSLRPSNEIGLDKVRAAIENERFKQEGSDGLISAAVLGRKLIANFGDWALSEEIDSVRAIAAKLGLEMEHENEAGNLEQLYPGCKIVKSISRKQLMRGCMSKIPSPEDWNQYRDSVKLSVELAASIANDSPVEFLKSIDPTVFLRWRRVAEKSGGSEKLRSKKSRGSASITKAMASIKRASDIAMKAVDRPVNVVVKHEPLEFTIKQEPYSQSAPIVNVSVPESPAPVVNVSVPESPAPQVNVNVEPAALDLSLSVDAKLPPRVTETSIERGTDDLISRVIQTERDV